MRYLDRWKQEGAGPDPSRQDRADGLGNERIETLGPVALSRIRPKIQFGTLPWGLLL